MTRIRRTKKEIEAGLTVESKKRGVTLEQQIEQNEQHANARVQARQIQDAATRKKPRKAAKKIVETYDEVDHKYKKIYKYRVQERIVEKEVPVIKEVRILNGTKGSEKTVQELLNQELNKCTWEWKELKMDNNFRATDMKELGKRGWKMTHIMEWRLLKEDWKKKPDTMFFQRPKQR
tara:strand:+ start:1796 stop:2326 length:531 start_codon:yes stop_codon:yes gene_type:complete